MRYLRLATQRLRTLLIALLWPLLFLALARLRPELLEQWTRVIELVTLALAVGGGLIAAGFAQWRLAHALVLVLVATLAAGFPEWPFAVTVLPVVAIAVLPWLREAGAFGISSAWTAAVLLICLALSWRAGAPVELADQWLRTELTWHEYSLSAAGLATLVLAAVTLLRLLVVQSAADLAFTGVLFALLALLPQTWHQPPAAAALAAVLTVWTGLLFHAWRLAYRDELTALPNRRALEDALKARPGRWSLGMLDVDHFKKFNDRWGHDVGDQVLRRVAATLARVEGRGRPFRYGGEEFSVLFPHDDLERAATALEAVRTALAAEPFRIRGRRAGASERGKQPATHEQTITVSAGLALGGNDAETTFKRADDALYKAKKKGRNRLVRAD
jgi:diguanylate cyclase (GGDEF)-like protein